jgi:hypothetical protein
MSVWHWLAGFRTKHCIWLKTPKQRLLALSTSNEARNFGKSGFPNEVFIMLGLRLAPKALPQAIDGAVRFG